MRLSRLSFRGLYDCYLGAEPVTIDFDALGPGLIALVGENGAGKTKAMESVPAGLFRRWPTRADDFYGNFRGRDAFIEEVFVEGETSYRIRVDVNAEGKKTEAYLFINDEPQSSGKVRDFAQAVGEHFSSESLFLASVFMPQTREGDFLGMGVAARQAFFAELLMLGAALAISEKAKARREDAERRAGEKRSALAAREDEIKALPELEASLLEREEAAAGRRDELARAREAEAEAIAIVERAKGAAERLASLRADVTAKKEALDNAETALAEAKEKPEGIRERHAERIRFLDEQLRKADTQPIYDAHTKAVAKLDAREKDLQERLAGVPDADQVRRDLELVKVDLATIEAEDRRAQGAAENVQRRQAELDHARTVLRSAQIAREKEVERLKVQAGLIAEVPCTDQEEWLAPGEQPADLAGTCPLLSNARKAKDELARLEALDGYPEEESVAETEAALHAAEVAEEEATRGEDQRKARHGELTLKKEQLTGDLARAEGAPQVRKDLATLADDRRELNQKHDHDLTVARESQAVGEKKKAEAEEQLAQDLAKAQEAIDAAQTSRDQADARHAAAADTLEKAAADTLDLATAEARKADATQAREAAETALRDADQAVTSLTTRIEDLRAKAEAMEPEREALRRIDTEIGDWRFHEEACGRTGYPQLEIAASGPEVSALANELLEVCTLEPRYSIKLETLRELRSKEGEYREAFDVEVYDRGVRKLAEHISPGQRTLISEAVSLALSEYNRRKSSIRWETLMRDETAGALDAKNAQGYIRMLRLAMKRGGFHQCLFVAHQKEVYEAADVMLHVAGGSIHRLVRNANGECEGCGGELTGAREAA